MSTRKQKFVVVPYRLVKGRPQPVEMRQVSTDQKAIDLAGRMSEHYAGVAAYEVIVCTETGDMHDPRELAVFGRAPDIGSLAA